MTTLNEDLDAAIALEAMMADSAEVAYEKLPTQDQRQAEYLAAIKDVDLDKFMELQEQLAELVEMVLSNPIDLDNLDKLTLDQAKGLMEEFLAQKQAKAFFDLRYNMLRAAVFEHITRVNAERKVAHPDRAPGEIPVPELGKKFTREGGKMKAAFDRAKMAEVLTPEQFATVYRTVHVEEQVIEAHDEEIFDEDALKDLVHANFGILEKLRGAVIPQGFTPSSLHVRPLKKSSKG